MQDSGYRFQEPDKGSANRIILCRIESISPEQKKIASLLYDQVVELNKAIPLLHHLKNAAEIRTCLARINSLENEADDLFERAIADLFDTCKDLIYLIKIKEHGNRHRSVRRCGQCHRKHHGQECLKEFISLHKKELC